MFWLPVCNIRSGFPSPGIAVRLVILQSQPGNACIPQHPSLANTWYHLLAIYYSDLRPRLQPGSRRDRLGLGMGNPGILTRYEFIQ